MHFLIKILGGLIEVLFEGIFRFKKEEPKVQKEDDASTKWRKWRFQRDEELEARGKG
jgi:hypothetical protein